MAKMIFILGGARSGKSVFAEKLAKDYHKVTYIATAEVKDEEIRQRVLRHQKRRPSHWKTIESPFHIDRVVSGLNELTDLILIDCITLYITNMILRDYTDETDTCLNEKQKNREDKQTEIVSEIRKLTRVCQKVNADVIIVSNEVGQGIIPDNTLSRNFLDISGFTNQILAEQANEVYYLVAGLAQRIK